MEIEWNLSEERDGTKILTITEKDHYTNGLVIPMELVAKKIADIYLIESK